MPPDHDIAFLLDLCGRIMFTHALDSELACRALGITTSDAQAIMAGERSSFALKPDRAACLPLFANILVRLELRFRHDGNAMRAALGAPLAALNGAAPADLLADGVEALRVIRASIDSMEAPTVRWWRVGH